MTPTNGPVGKSLYMIIALGAFLFFGYSISKRARFVAKARSDNRLDKPILRTLDLLPWVVGNLRVARPRFWYSGILHTFILWGFIVLQVRTLNFLLEGVSERITLQKLGGWLYRPLMPVMDLFNLLVLVGVGMAAARRLLFPPKRLTVTRDGYIILGFTTAMMVTDIMANATKIALERPNWGPWSPVALVVSWIFRGLGGGLIKDMHGAFWFLHLVSFLGFLNYLPYSKHSHVLTVIPNVLFKSRKPSGVLEPIQDFETAESFGAGKLHDLSWKQLLDSYTCTECGRCTAACPANATGKLLSPQKIIMDIRHLAEDELSDTGASPEEKEPSSTLPQDVGFEPIWDCVTCGACMYECPVFIEHVPTIMDMRRYLVMEDADMPETAQATLTQLEQRGHPWRGTQLTRTDWIDQLKGEGFEVPVYDGSQEYLFWVGCSGALQERNVKVTKSIVRLLAEGGVSFGVLGDQESCSGDPARRLGNEYMYQMQAQANIDQFKEKNVQKVITNCPHCFNIMKHEYPQLDGHFDVSHHSEVLDSLIAEGKLRTEKTNGLSEKTVTYHDPCYMARHNDVLEEPRRAIAATGADVVEMGRCRKQTFCCGAGGSHMWMEDNRGERMSHVRTAEAVDSGADVVAVGCPFCMQMFEEGVGSVDAAAERGLQVFDIAELVEMSTTYSKPASPASPEDAPDT